MSAPCTGTLTTSPMLDPTRVAMRIHKAGARPVSNEKAPHAAAAPMARGMRFQRSAT